MPYTAGILVNIDQDTALEKEMVFTKKVDSDLLLKVLSINENATYTPGNLTDMTAIQTDSGDYEVIELSLELTYDGTELEDIFSATGSLDLTQDS